MLSIIEAQIEPLLLITSLKTKENTVKDNSSIEKLERLSKLEDNWDGEGAKAITAKSMENATALIDKVYGLHTAIPYDIAPLFDGSLLVEWRGPHGNLEVEVGEENFGYLLVSPECLEGDNVDETVILALASEIFEPVTT